MNINKKMKLSALILCVMLVGVFCLGSCGANTPKELVNVTVSVIGPEGAAVIDNQVVTLDGADSPTVLDAVANACTIAEITPVYETDADENPLRIRTFGDITADGANQYWDFTLNGVTAEEGAAQTIVADGDKIVYSYFGTLPETTPETTPTTE
jgi:hypothetical protein